MKIYANSGSEIVDSTNNTIYKYDLDTNDFETLKDDISIVLKDNGIKGDLLFQKTEIDIDSVDLTVLEGQAILVKYQNIEGQTPDEISVTNDAIEQALIKMLGLESHSEFHSAVVNAGSRTAVASSELLTNSLLAMLVAIVLILIYIIIRFELTSGFSAILALFHDLLIMISFVLIFRTTINASFIAGLVTILGYSINNTIIIFDRIRENLRSGIYEKSSNHQIANVSVKETITRSVYTTITTFVTVLLVAVIGVADIRDFAFPIAIGILAGFYSSVFITPGLWAIAFKGLKTKKIKKRKTEEV